jgi:transcriptional regulator with XRE-family HTH domain
MRELGEEFRHTRVRLGLSQREVAAAAKIHRSTYTRIEAGKLRSVAFVVLSRIAALLGLDLPLRAFPGGRSIRDRMQSSRLLKIVAWLAGPLAYRADVPLPPVLSRHEQRAWDLVIFGHGLRTAIEFEARLYDLQAQLRRWRLKWRDDPVDRLLIVVADTRANRRILAEFGDLLADFPRLTEAELAAQLRAGQHPATGVVLLSPPATRTVRAPAEAA